MNTKEIFDGVLELTTGGRIADSAALDHLSEGPVSRLDRDNGAFGVDNLKVKSLVTGGAVGLLLGTRPGRFLGGKMLKYSTIAGIGVLAWNAWQEYRASHPGTPPRHHGLPLKQLQYTARERRSLLLLRTTLMASRADGNFDEAKRTALMQRLDTLGANDELKSWIEAQLEDPVDFDTLALEVDSHQEAREVYLVSVAVIEDNPPLERPWLNELALALGLPQAEALELQRQALANA
ncbi:tellurite resistance TerB family protein [Litchfieldella rifensis]|uniref:Tellurite resistance TerB family protein n=1 Tax=Litchfieldella rifensis TaxID=762643 RepID=A0ABV7LMM4_9GAMM